MAKFVSKAVSYCATAKVAGVLSLEYWADTPQLKLWASFARKAPRANDWDGTRWLVNGYCGLVGFL